MTVCCILFHGWCTSYCIPLIFSPSMLVRYMCTTSDIAILPIAGPLPHGNGFHHITYMQGLLLSTMTRPHCLAYPCCRVIQLIPQVHLILQGLGHLRNPVSQGFPGPPPPFGSIVWGQILGITALPCTRGMGLVCGQSFPWGQRGVEVCRGCRHVSHTQGSALIVVAEYAG